MPIGAFKLNSLSKATLTASVQVIRRKKTIQAIGNVQISDTQSKFGGSSAYFDGTGDYLITPADSSLSFGTGDFTVECWVRISANSTANSGGTRYANIIATVPSGGGGTNYEFGIIGDATNTGTGLFFTSWVSGTYAGPSATFTFAKNTWYHIAASRSSGNIKFFVDGTQIGTTQSHNVITNCSNEMRIAGTAVTAYKHELVGFIDELRISNTARYTANFTAPTTPFTNDDNTLLLLHMDGSYLTNNFYDDNGIRLPKPMTNNNTNAKLSTTQAKFGGTSLVCDGNSDYVTTRWDQIFSDLEFGTGNFTAECWAYLSGNSTFQCLISLRNASAGIYNNALAVSGGYLQWSDGTAWRLATTTFPINQWVHVAVTRTSGTLRLFQNGTQVYSATNTVNLNGQRPIYIGSFDDGSYSANGYIDEVRVSNISRYSSAFTPSTAPFVNDANTLLLLHFNGSNNSTIFLDDTGDGRTQTGVVPSGNAQISTTQSYFSGTSAYFDGTGDYLTSINLPTIGTGDFTFEFWVRPTAAGLLNKGIFHFSPTGIRANATDDIAVGFINSTQWVVYRGGTYAFPNTSTITADTWHHVALSRSSGTTTLYWNGTSINSAADTFNYSGTQIGIGGYYSTSNLLIGYIDEFRISNSARYTANFTAPTAPFANDSNTLLLLHMDGNNTSTIFIDDNGKKTYTI